MPSSRSNYNTYFAFQRARQVVRRKLRERTLAKVALANITAWLKKNLEVFRTLGDNGPFAVFFFKWRLLILTLPD